MKFECPLGSTGIRSRIARIPFLGKLLGAALAVPSPYYHPRRSPARLAYDRVVSRSRAPGRKPRMLRIGSRDPKETGFIHLDIAQHGSADVLGDARAMPFRDGTFDLIVAVAVLEHVRAPHEVASEFHRLLKPGGTLYCAVPFVTMFHPDPLDVQRYTVTGLADLFGDLRCIENGVELGPASAVSLVLREFLAILFSFNSRLLYNLAQVLFGYLTLPLKFLDRFLVWNRFAFMIACSVYFVGMKDDREG